MLRIGDVDYALRRLEGPLPRWSLPREGGPCYRVIRTEAGIECSFPDFAFRHGGGDAGCKHARAMVACGLFEMSSLGARGRQAGGTAGDRPAYVERRRSIEPRTSSEAEWGVLSRPHPQPAEADTEAY